MSGEGIKGGFAKTKRKKRIAAISKDKREPGASPPGEAALTSVSLISMQLFFF